MCSFQQPIKTRLASLCKIQGLFKDFIKTASVFRDKFMKNTDLKETEIMDLKETEIMNKLA